MAYFSFSPREINYATPWCYFNIAFFLLLKIRSLFSGTNNVLEVLSAFSTIAEERIADSNIDSEKASLNILCRNFTLIKRVFSARITFTTNFYSLFIVCLIVYGLSLITFVYNISLFSFFYIIHYGNKSE